jgi:hypothetical protein
MFLIFFSFPVPAFSSLSPHLPMALEFSSQQTALVGVFPFY